MSKPFHAELYRDRTNPVDDGMDLAAETAPGPEEVDASLVREVLLGSIGLLKQRVTNGRFSNLDAQTLEKLLELAKDWPQLAKAVEELKAWGAQKEAAKSGAINPQPATKRTVRALRAVLEKPDFGKPSG